MSVLTRIGKDGVLLRLPRPVTVILAVGTAAVAIGLSAAPLSADQVRSQEWWLSSLGISNVWSDSQGSGVTVAVLSDGVNGSHPDLAGAVTTAPPVAGAPQAVGQYFGEQGTPIASLIAGHGDGSNGASGIIGVAPEARILSVPVTLPADDPQLGDPAIAGGIPAAIASGINYAVSNGASVIDLPIDPGEPGSNGSGGASAAAGGSAAEQAAVSSALAHNVVLVAPAGDNALTTDAPNYPAAYSGVIAVGAFDSAFDKSPWTSHRSYVTLTAAGVGVVAASGAAGYQPMNSTSAASAVVAGIVALIKSRYPGLSVADIRQALTTTTMFHRPNGQAIGSGAGAVDAAKAYSAAAALATPSSDLAGAGAQPLTTPGPATAGKGAESLKSQIIRGGEISAAVLGLLLLIVICYALIGRRRRPSRLPAALAAQWTAGHAQSRYPHAPVTEADRMLQLFATPVATPAPAGGRTEIGEGTARRALPIGAWQADDDLFTAPSPVDVGGSGSASRAVSGRAAVSGTPPWEPAQQPDGEVPWADAPARQTVPGEVVASAVSEPARDSEPSWEGQPEWADRAARRNPADRIETMRASAPLRWTEQAGRHTAEPVAPSSSQSSGGGWPGPPGAADRFDRRPATDASGQHQSGLPVRQPRNVSSGPLSPSGALWESSPGGGSLWERAEQSADSPPAQTTDASGRPIFVWDPEQVAADSRYRQASDLARRRGQQRSGPGEPPRPDYQ